VILKCYMLAPTAEVSIGVLMQVNPGIAYHLPPDLLP